jgi:hypothetical protein
MNKFIALVSLVVVAMIGLIDCKCDMLKEFKPEFDEIQTWAKARCDKSMETQPRGHHHHPGYYPDNELTNPDHCPVS